MKYRKTILLKDGRECILRSGEAGDAQAALDVFVLTHSQSDWLLSTPEEIHFTVEQEARFLQDKAENSAEVELAAEIDGKIVGLAGIEPVGSQGKVRHRATFGISVDQACWGLGVGRGLTEACIECAKKAGYTQLELDVVADNRRAMALYESVGFAEYGRNPRGFLSPSAGMQELVLMRLVLDA